MNHDPKYNEFEYEKENYPKTPEHFKQFVAAQVEKELKQTSIVRHRARKKYFPAKVAAAVIVCAAVGTTGAYAGVKQYQARSQQYLQETGRITAPETSSEEEKDYASVLANAPLHSYRGECTYCGHCKPCVSDLDIAMINKFYDLATMQPKVPATVQSHYELLEHKASECIGCQACESRCPFGVPIAERMKKTAELFGC